MADTPASRNIVRADGHVSGDDRAPPRPQLPNRLVHRAVGFGQVDTCPRSSGRSSTRVPVLCARGIRRFGLNRDPASRRRPPRTSDVSAGPLPLPNAGLVVLSAPPACRPTETRSGRCTPGQFVEVFVDTPIEVCEDRDERPLRQGSAATSRSSAESRAVRSPDVTGDPVDTARPIDERRTHPGAARALKAARQGH